MIEQLRKHYYWGDVDKNLYKFNYDSYVETINKLFTATDIEDINSILFDSFKECKDIYQVARKIIFEYICGGRDVYKYQDDFMQLVSDDGDWYHWDLLRRIFGGINAQYYSGLCRKTEVMLLNKLDKSTDELYLRKYSVFSSEWDIKNAELILAKCQNSVIRRNWEERYEELIDYHSTVFQRKTIDDDFGKYVEGKKVVVVGVAPHSSSDIKEENVVYVFLNYSGKKNMADEDRNKHPDISYYSVYATNKAINENADYLRDLDYVVCKSKVENINALYAYNSKMRISHPLMFGCPFGHPLMIPIVIYDLLHYKVKDIQIINTNLYSSVTSYYSGYTDKNCTRELIRDLPSHDLVGNWMLMKNWYHHGLFSCDDELRSILEMTQEEYTLTVEKSFYSALENCGKD